MTILYKGLAFKNQIASPIFDVIYEINCESVEWLVIVFHWMQELLDTWNILVLFFW